MQNCISLSVIWISHISSCTQSTFLPCLKFKMLPLLGSFKVMLYVTTTLHKTYVNLCFPSKMSYFSPALRNKIIPPHDAVKFSEFLSNCWTSTISLMSTNTGSNITWTITKQSLWETGPSREPIPWFTQHWDTFRALFSELLSVCYDNTKWKKKNTHTHTQNMMHPLKSAFRKLKLLLPSNRLWSVNVHCWLTSLHVPWGVVFSGACIRSLNVSIVQLCSPEI